MFKQVKRKFQPVKLQRRTREQGKGVRNIYQPVEQTSFAIGEIESFRESALRNGQSYRTQVLLFMELTADEALSAKTGWSNCKFESRYFQREEAPDRQIHPPQFFVLNPCK
mgnify:CR=1 FL=1